jgi:Delta3-Delta2-enoyl-CoA isomerase
MCCDYRVITAGTKRNAWMSMNEVHFGAPLPLSFTALFRAKVGDGRVQREVTLEGKRITPQRAKEVGLVDFVHGDNTQEVLSKAVEVAKEAQGGARTGVWGLIKVSFIRFGDG